MCSVMVQQRPGGSCERCCGPAASGDAGASAGAVDSAAFHLKFRGCVLNLPAQEAALFQSCAAAAAPLHRG